MHEPADLTERAKLRADLVVVDQGLADSRARAQALIGLGAVIVVATGEVVDKAGQLLPARLPLRLRHQPLPYASRAGGKLAAAFDAYPFAIAGLDCLDVGASTGGFTDFLLKHDARRVVALDVGHNQLAHRLRIDPRVTVREHCHAVHADDSAVPWPCDVIVMDVSFISATQVLPALGRWAKGQARAVVLVKPQFEVGREHIERGGIVRSPVARARALAKVTDAALGCGWRPLGSLASPVLGTKGNAEYLLVLERAKGAS